MKNHRGITLIALVTTVILMLILATVVVTGVKDGGLFKRAASAVKETQLANKKEIIQQAAVLALGSSKNGRITEAELKQQLDKYEDIEDIKAVGGIFVIEFKDGKEYILNQKTDIQDKKGKFAYELTAQDYGNYVFNYSDINAADGGASQLADWQIFYSGKVSDEADDHIYLIASNCIPVDDTPISRNGYNVNKINDNDYQGYFTSILSDYSNGSDDVAEQTRYLNREYYNYLQINNNINKNNNMKALAYLCDTNKWSKFKTDKADFAIGGPTVELFMKSYNKKYNGNFMHGYTTLDNEGNLIVAKDSNGADTITNSGYKVSIGGNTWSNNISLLRRETDRTYIGSYSYWLLSPSADAARSLKCYYKSVNNDVISGSYCNVDIRARAFRPIVRLKADTQLIKVDGGYRIVE